MTGVGHKVEQPDRFNNQLAEAGPLLEQTRWLLNDFAARLESFNARAGVMLGVSVAVIALGIPTVALLFHGPAAWLAGFTVTVLYTAPIGFALRTLGVRSGHGIGPVAVRKLVDENGYPKGERGKQVEMDLLRSLWLQPTDGSPSVVAGLENECDRKGTLLNLTQWALVGASGLAVLAAIIVAVCGR